MSPECGANKNNNSNHVRITSPLVVVETDVAGNVTDLESAATSPLTVNDKEFHDKYLLKNH